MFLRNEIRSQISHASFVQVSCGFITQLANRHFIRKASSTLSSMAINKDKAKQAKSFLAPLVNTLNNALSVPRSALLIESALLQQRKAPVVRWSFVQNLTRWSHLHVDAAEPFVQQLLSFPGQNARFVVDGADHTLATVAFPVVE